MIKKQWIGVDLDGTLAEVGRDNLGDIGKPITKMMNRVKKWLEDGEYEVRIFTARAGDKHQENKIKQWLKDNNLPELVITNLKSQNMLAIWDDKAVRVERNSGEICNGCNSSVNYRRLYSMNTQIFSTTDC